MIAPYSATCQALVSVVVTTYNHAHFLADAIDSVLNQTAVGCEIMVVDDGSTDDTAELVSRYIDVHYVRQPNQGLSAARNTGLRESHGRYIVFLDADDRLMPGAVAAGLNCFLSYPESAFVSGRHRRISRDGHPIGQPTSKPIRPPHYHALLRGNYIGMHATVMYDRHVLEEVGGFDISLPACEDYDMYLRIARRFPVATHDQVVAEYRIHNANTSRNIDLMLSTALRVLRSQTEHVKNDPRMRAAFEQGLRNWRQYYSKKLLADLSAARHRHGSPAAQIGRAAWTLVRLAPAASIAHVLSALKRRVRGRRRSIPQLPAKRPIPAPEGKANRPGIGGVRFGDFRRLTPVSRRFGFDRGCPIDRYYIESFLAQHAHVIRGRVLEIGDDAYTFQFGGERVVCSDVLHVHAGNPKATFVDDLAIGKTLPSAAFDCVILTQTLHLIYDVKAALATVNRILKPGGVLLMTVPGTISQLEQGTWSGVWHWGFTALSIRKLCVEIFATDPVEVVTYGSVLTSIAFLQGLAASELKPDELDHHDPLYPLLHTVRIRKHAQPATEVATAKMEPTPIFRDAVTATLN